MRILYSFILLFFCKIILSQAVLTNRQLHNYNVGDTVQYDEPHNFCGSPPKYTERIVIHKEINANDIIYTFKKNYKYMCGPSCMWSDGTTTYTLQVTDLDSAVKYIEVESLINCLSQQTSQDSFYVDHCSKNINQRNYIMNTNPNCFLLGHSKLVAGVGEFYDITLKFNADPCHFIKNLFYYHKINEHPCGNRAQIGAEQPKPLVENKLLVYPNVIAGNMVNIECVNYDNLTLSIFSSDGKEIQQSKIYSGITSLNLDLNVGMYVLKFEASDTKEILYRKIIVIN